MSSRIRTALITGAAVLLSAGCRPDKPDTSDRAAEAKARVTAQNIARSGGEPSEPEAGKGALTPEQRALVVAKVGNTVITLGDVERELAKQPAFVRAKYTAFDKKVEFLNGLVEFELLAAEAERKGLDSDPEVVLAMKRAMVEKFLERDVARQITVTAVAEEEVQRFYENNKTLFNKPEAIRVSRLRVVDKAQADQLLVELRAAIAADKDKAKIIFGDFVRRYSKDTDSAMESGDLGFVVREGWIEGGGEARTRLPEPIVAAAFALADQTQLSDALPVEGGFDILQVTARRPKVERTLDDARRQITNALLRDKQDTARSEFIAGLRSKASVTIDEKILGQIDPLALTTPRKGVPDLAPAVPGGAPAVPKSGTVPSLRPHDLLDPHTRLPPGSERKREVPEAVREQIRNSPRVPQ